MRLVRREENHVVAIGGKRGGARGLTQDALAPVPKDGVSKALRCNEGDPTRIAFVERCYSDSQKGVVVPSPLREDPLKISLGLDGLHQTSLDSETLAALCTTTGENGTAALGGHAGTEAVGGGALALVGLIRTLHSYSSRLGMNVLLEQ